MNHEIGIIPWLWDLRASIAKGWGSKLPSLTHSSSKLGLAPYGLPLATHQRYGLKGNPWNGWINELGKNSLNLLTYDGTSTSKRSPILHTNPWIRPLGEESKKWIWFLLSSPWRGWGVEGVHELLLVLSPLPLHLLQSFLQSLASLAPRVLACCWVS